MRVGGLPKDAGEEKELSRFDSMSLSSTTSDSGSNTERLFHSIHFDQNVEQGKKSGIRSIKSSLFYKKKRLPAFPPASIDSTCHPVPPSHE